MTPLQLRRAADEVVERFRKGEIGCRSETISKLIKIDPDSELSAQELAQIILEDYGLVTKVLQTVNSFYYNRLGQEITTVTQAVILLGFNSIREIALGMAIIELLPEGTTGIAVRLMAQAYLSAHIAQEIAGDSKSPSPEEIFLAALFRPFARIVTALFDPELYKAITAMEGDPKDGVHVQEFFRSVGWEIGEYLRLPSIIGRHLEGMPEPRSSVDVRLRKLLDECHRIALGLMAPEEPPFLELPHRLRTLARRYRQNTKTLVHKILISVGRTTSYTPKFKEILNERIIRKAIRNELVPELEGSGQQDAAEVVGKAPKDQEELFLDLISQLQSLVLTRTTTLDQVYLMATESLHRGLVLDRVVLCMLNPKRTELVARYGLGIAVKGLKDGLRIPFPSKSQPMATAFNKEQEVVTTWGQIPSVAMIEPEERLKRLVCISPLVVKGRPLGCFLMDRFKSGDRFDAKDLKRIRAIRQTVVLATTQTMLRQK